MTPFVLELVTLLSITLAKLLTARGDATLEDDALCDALEGLKREADRRKFAAQSV